MQGLGRNIRTMRKARRLTLTQLAADTGFSKGYISQVERGLVNPSIAALQKIAGVLETPVSFFFGEQEGSQGPHPRIVRSGDRRILRYPDSGIEYQLLSPDFRSRFTLLYIREVPGASSHPQPIQHDGEELILVLAGALEYWAGDEKYVLEKGDTIWHFSSLPHKWKVIGNEEVEVVSVHASSLF